MRQTIGLCMIVKNEAPIIVRCLNSVKPLIDYVLVVDTGSTDDTEQEIYTWLNQHSLPGKVIQEPWQDFAHNRSFALEQIRKLKEVDYVLMIDADQVLTYQIPESMLQNLKNQLHHDLYLIQIQEPNSTYYLPRLTRNEKPFYYQGVLHEYLVCEESIYSQAYLEGIVNRPIQDSFRNQRPDKYLRDIATLKTALKGEKNPELAARYCFYLAQSYRDAGEPEAALAEYQRRILLGIGRLEVFYSLYQSALLKEQLNHAPEMVIQAYLQAFEHSPERAEPLYDAMYFARLQGWYQQAYMIGYQGKKLQQPREGLFINAMIYDFALLDEFALVAFRSGNYQESESACRTLLNRTLPPEMRARVAHNLEQVQRVILKNN